MERSKQVDPDGVAGQWFWIRRRMDRDWRWLTESFDPKL